MPARRCRSRLPIAGLRVPFLVLVNACASAPPRSPTDDEANQAVLVARMPRGRPITLSRKAQDAFIKEVSPVTEDRAGPVASRVGRIVQWVHKRVVFSSDRHNTLDGILADGRGNCWDHAALLMALLELNGLEARVIREVNAQPQNPGRAERAKARNRSIFGFEQNDHTWVEAKVDDEWIPVDSSLGITGTREWVQRRLITGEEETYGMIAPFAIIAHSTSGSVDRTHHYLVDVFAAEVPQVQQLAAFKTWARTADYFGNISVAVLEEQHDLTTDADRIHEVSNTIKKLRLLLPKSLL